MPNHFHLLIQEKEEGNAGKFTKKITSAHTQYFNLQNDRSGVLFQGRTKIIPMKKDSHFLYLPFYLLTNPLKLKQANWKKHKIKNKKEMLNFLENYKWSSYQEILEKNKFPDIINKKLFFEIYNTNKKEVKKELQEIINAWLKKQTNTI